MVVGGKSQKSNDRFLAWFTRFRYEHKSRNLQNGSMFAVHKAGLRQATDYNFRLFSRSHYDYKMLATNHRIHSTGTCQNITKTKFNHMIVSLLVRSLWKDRKKF